MTERLNRTTPRQWASNLRPSGAVLTQHILNMYYLNAGSLGAPQSFVTSAANVRSPPKATVAARGQLRTFSPHSRCCCATLHNRLSLETDP